MKKIILVFAILLVVIIIGCVSVPTTRLGAELVKQPAHRFNYAGFSVVPPPGDGWYETRMVNEITFIKSLSLTDNFIADVTISQIKTQIASSQDFLQFVKKSRSKEMDAQKYSYSVNNYQLDPAIGSYCIRYQQIIQDPPSSTVSEALVLKGHGIACLHPDDPHRVVYLSYAEISGPGRSNPAVYAEGEAFLSSLQFVPVEMKNP